MAPPIAPNKILLADNDPVLVATVGRELREAGFEVLEAFDSSTAFDVCMGHTPSLAILDYELSGATGVELAHQIANHTSVPVILTSSNSDEAVVRNATAA